MEDKLIQYEVKTVRGSFTIYTNQDLETFKACLINWEARTGAKRLKAMRQSLIDYINSKSFAGFIAVKNKKEYNKIINS